jgi:triphosphoribosyl-dephospho-CoA synthetase
VLRPENLNTNRKAKAMKYATHTHKQAFATYLADYIREELERSLELDYNTILNAIDAFESGAHGLGEDLTIAIERTA